MKYYKYHIEGFAYILIFIVFSLYLVQFDIFEWVYESTRQHEDWNLDEIFTIIPGVLIILIVFGYRRTTELQKEVKIRQTAENEIRKELVLKRDFISIVSHEMRTPLNGIIGLFEAIQVMKTDNERQEMIDYAIEAAHGLSRQLDDVISFSRIDRNKFELQDECLNPSELIQKAVALLRHEAEDKGVLLELHLSEDIPQYIISNKGPLNQIIYNLAQNALKFTSHGKVLLRMQYTNKGAEQGILHLLVSDTGCGIPNNQLEHIFKPFHQIEYEQNRKYQGLGLGLSLVQRLVGLMGGEIDVKSVLERGTQFNVFIPVRLPVRSD